MNILYIGSSGALSLIPFRKLLSNQYSISAVGIYSPVVFNNKVIAIENESLALAANQKNIPVIDFSQTLKEILKQCNKYSIDIILMSCYSKRLPVEIINLAEKGCYNMHPSLLPRYRGPEPVFWQMREASDMGVSWHQVIDEFDAGDVVAQKKVIPVEAGSYSDLSLQLAETGSRLLMELLSDLPSAIHNKSKQDPELASYYPYPEQKDFVINTYTAQQCYNFMRATQIFGFPYLYQLDKHCYFPVEALDYDNNISLESVEIRENRLYIPCNEGVLITTYTDKMPS